MLAGHVWCYRPVTLSGQRLRKKSSQLEARLSYITRPHLKTKQNTIDAGFFNLAKYLSLIFSSSKLILGLTSINHNLKKYTLL